MSDERVLTREQLEEWGLPFDLASEMDADPDGLAVELHREQVDTRRWYSVHRLVFRAPDDGQPWSVTYFRGLTEIQEDLDKWNDQPQVTATRMERYERTVIDWRPVSESKA